MKSATSHSLAPYSQIDVVARARVDAVQYVLLISPPPPATPPTSASSSTTSALTDSSWTRDAFWQRRGGEYRQDLGFKFKTNIFRYFGIREMEKLLEGTTHEQVLNVGGTLFSTTSETLCCFSGSF